MPRPRDWLPAAAEALIESAYRDALVIGCETTPCVAAALTRLGIPLLDTIGHPIRFLDDLLNAWRSNHAGMANALTDFEYDVELARAQAGLISAKMAWRPPLDAPQDSALLIGQVGSDKALIDLDPLTDQRKHEYDWLMSDGFPKTLAAQNVTLA